MSGARVVYKYPMQPDGTVTIPVGTVRHIAAQHPGDALPMLWVEHELDAQMGASLPGTMTVQVLGTGDLFTGDKVEYLGTAVCANGQLVWHCYRRTDR